MKRGLMPTLALWGLLILLTANVAAEAQQEPRNKILFDAMSPYEDLTEYALTRNASKVEETIKALRPSLEKVRTVVTDKSAALLREDMDKLIWAAKKHEFAQVALYAVDSYKRLVDELDTAELSVPREVAILDFVGFKIHALLAQKKVDWLAIHEVVAMGKEQWDAIEKAISDKGLRAAMNTAVKGFQTAAQSKNTEMLRFAAQVDLDLVDLLENYFENRK